MLLSDDRSDSSPDKTLGLAESTRILLFIITVGVVELWVSRSLHPLFLQAFRNSSKTQKYYLLFVAHYDLKCIFCLIFFLYYQAWTNENNMAAYKWFGCRIDRFHHTLYTPAKNPLLLISVILYQNKMLKSL